MGPKCNGWRATLLFSLLSPPTRGDLDALLTVSKISIYAIFVEISISTLCKMSCLDIIHIPCFHGTVLSPPIHHLAPIQFHPTISLSLSHLPHPHLHLLQPLCPLQPHPIPPHPHLQPQKYEAMRQDPS
ncbi:hypothetical protein QBC38DRAFT_479489 [Podospora fimiseda]|uniref:Uncharacterized protein n=1 Tax=Podospora fimiseda TaxID=252190 RepID=A0AAN7GY52_9PEZI|nr:hypothetical protein QBC38DRAFT_479489 [Podospora fimiseda]